MSLRPEFLEQIRINKSQRIRDPEQAEAFAANRAAGGPLDALTLTEGLISKLTDQERKELEHVPRDTVLKMLSNKQLDEPFMFMTALGEGDNYVQAMRQVLSRTRKKAKSKKIRLQEFKLFVQSIESKENHDVVIMIRTKQMPANLESVYDALIDVFEKK